MSQPEPATRKPLPFAAGTPGVWYAVVAVLGLALAAALFFFNLRPKSYSLRITAGDKLGRRHKIAQVLAGEAEKRGVRTVFVDSSGSDDALRKVSSGALDVALIQGGIGTAPHVREVAVFAQEPLHLLVKRETADAVTAQGLRALRGKTINLSTKGSGTRRVALIALEFADMKAGRDYADEYVSYEQLATRSYRYLPDALFTVSLIPSPVVETLVHKHGYRMVPIPFARALSLRHPTLHETVIPPFAYGMVPAPTPPAAVTTVGTQLLLIARDDVPDEAVKRLLLAAFGGEFARGAVLTDLSEARFLDAPEMPIHPGAIAYRDRDNPVVTSDFVQGLEDGKSLILSVLVSGYFVYRWIRQRRFRGFDAYLARVTQVEREVIALESEATPPLKELMALRQTLGELKTEALEKFANGELRGEELLAAFLTHVADVRGYLSALILAERERLAEISRDTLPDAEQTARFREQWEGETGAKPRS
ncbi:MAG: hypothetical protein H7Y38_03575 [Armatimonadetes bacterium]|nr:hypothetical protein [Armatimonadota bacterium]